MSSKRNKKENVVLAHTKNKPMIECSASQPVAAQVFHAGGERQRSRLDRRRGGVPQTTTAKVHFGVRPYKPSINNNFKLSLVSLWLISSFEILSLSTIQTFFIFF